MPASEAITKMNQVRKTQMGATKPYYAKITAETAGSLPTYGTPTDFSEFVKVTENLNKAETQYYSNDAMSENGSSVKYCELTYDNKGVPNSVSADIFGVTLDAESGEMTYGGDDTPPFIGFGFYRTLIDKGEVFYEGVFYPKVKASLGNSTYETKGDGITLSGDSVTMLAYICSDSAKTWKKTEMFATSSEAEAWVKKKLGVTA